MLQTAVEADPSKANAACLGSHLLMWLVMRPVVVMHSSWTSVISTWVQDREWAPPHVDQQSAEQLQLNPSDIWKLRRNFEN